MNIWPYGDHMHFLPWLWKMSLERQHWKYSLHTKKVVHQDLLTKIGVLSACIAYVPSPQDHMCWDDAYIEYYDTASFTVLGNSVKNLPATQDTWFDPWVRDPWRRKWQPTPVFLPGEFHGQRSPTGCNPWGYKEWALIEWLVHTQKA